MGRGFRQEEVLCHSGKGSACDTQAQNAPSCTGSSVRLSACLQAWVVPLESAGAFQARGVPSDKGSALRHWRLCPVSTEPGALCWEYRAWRGFLGFYVSLSVLPQEALWWEHRARSLLGRLCLPLTLSFPWSAFRHCEYQFQALGVTTGLQSLWVKTAATGSHCRYWEWLWHQSLGVTMISVTGNDFDFSLWEWLQEWLESLGETSGVTSFTGSDLGSDFHHWEWLRERLPSLGVTLSSVTGSDFGSDWAWLQTWEWLTSVTGHALRHWACLALQAWGQPSGMGPAFRQGKPSVKGPACRHGTWLQAWGMSSCSGCGFR